MSIDILTTEANALIEHIENHFKGVSQTVPTQVVFADDCPELFSLIAQKMKLPQAVIVTFDKAGWEQLEREGGEAISWMLERFDIDQIFIGASSAAGRETVPEGSEDTSESGAAKSRFSQMVQAVSCSNRSNQKCRQRIESIIRKFAEHDAIRAKRECSTLPVRGIWYRGECGSGVLVDYDQAQLIELS